MVADYGHFFVFGVLLFCRSEKTKYIVVLMFWRCQIAKAPKTPKHHQNTKIPKRHYI
jgi:hypothetical protein